MQRHGEARARKSSASKASRASRDVLLTRAALILFIAGFVLGSLGFFTGVIAAFEILAPLVTLTGIALMILGRRSFDRRHALAVLIAAVLYVALLGIFLSWATGFAGSVQDVVNGGLYTPGSLEDLLTTQVLLQATINAFLGLPLLLFVIRLEDRLGRFVALLAAAVAILLNILLPLLILPSLTWIVTNSNNLRPVQFDEFEANLNRLTALAALVNLLWIAPYAIAYWRVSRGDVLLVAEPKASGGKAVTATEVGRGSPAAPPPLLRAPILALGLALLLLIGVSLGMVEASRQPHIEVADQGFACGPGPTNLTYTFTVVNSGKANGYATAGFYETQQFGRQLLGTQRFLVPVGASLTRVATIMTPQCDIQSSAPFVEITAVEKA